jgi:hypothetical protein
MMHMMRQGGAHHIHLPRANMYGLGVLRQAHERVLKDGVAPAMAALGSERDAESSRYGALRTVFRCSVWSDRARPPHHALAAWLLLRVLAVGTWPDFPLPRIVTFFSYHAPCSSVEVVRCAHTYPGRPDTSPSASSSEAEEA